MLTREEALSLVKQNITNQKIRKTYLISYHNQSINFIYYNSIYILE
jgi:hypothetical protein